MPIQKVNLGSTVTLDCLFATRNSLSEYQALNVFKINSSLCHFFLKKNELSIEFWRHFGLVSHICAEKLAFSFAARGADELFFFFANMMQYWKVTSEKEICPIFFTGVNFNLLNATVHSVMYNFKLKSLFCLRVLPGLFNPSSRL